MDEAVRLDAQSDCAVRVHVCGWKTRVDSDQRESMAVEDR